MINCVLIQRFLACVAYGCCVASRYACCAVRRITRHTTISFINQSATVSRADISGRLQRYFALTTDHEKKTEATDTYSSA